MESSHTKYDPEKELRTQLKAVLGEDDYYRLLELLDNVTNGLCAVEMYWHTIPNILKSRGIKPNVDMADHDIEPEQNGKQAATPVQRELITDELKKAGFTI